MILSPSLTLLREGYSVNDVVCPFHVRHYILDAPARAFVKCCVRHNTYCSCEKCCVHGEYIANRMTYADIDAGLRTDESYRNQTQPNHHEGRSPLEFVGTRMVTQFRLDPFHLVYLGVFKRLLSVWTIWNGGWKLHWTAVDAISDLLNLLSPTCPSDFTRKPRSLKYLKLYKGTKLRRMCHYDSVLVFRDCLDINVYRNFLLLFVALYILGSPVFVKSQQMREYADNLLQLFIQHSIQIYGHVFVVYNVHALCHLSKECEAHGSLDEFSAFKFENALKSLKQTLKSHYQPLQQVAFRDCERQLNGNAVILPSEEFQVSLSQPYTNNDEVLPGSHYKRITIGKIMLHVNGKDSCFKTRNGKVVVLHNIVCVNDNVVSLVGNCFQEKLDFFVYPLQSSKLGIFKVSNLSAARRVFEVADIVAKY